MPNLRMLEECQVKDHLITTLSLFVAPKLKTPQENRDQTVSINISEGPRWR